MNKYRVFRKKIFESDEKFEKRLNEECRKGYRPINLTYDAGAGLVVLLEKTPS
jgi:hypothetical protein